jgi:hypothetical protein
MGEVRQQHGEIATTGRTERLGAAGGAGGMTPPIHPSERRGVSCAGPLTSFDFLICACFHAFISLNSPRGEPITFSNSSSARYCSFLVGSMPFLASWSSA